MVSVLHVIQLALLPADDLDQVCSEGGAHLISHEQEHMQACGPPGMRFGTTALKGELNQVSEAKGPVRGVLNPDPTLMLVLLFRPDGHQNNLRSAAYEALMEIVKNSAKDCYPAVQKTTLVIMERLQQVLQMEVGTPSPGSSDWTR